MVRELRTTVVLIVLILAGHPSYVLGDKHRGMGFKFPSDPLKQTSKALITTYLLVKRNAACAYPSRGTLLHHILPNHASQTTDGDYQNI